MFGALLQEGRRPQVLLRVMFARKLFLDDVCYFCAFLALSCNLFSGILFDPESFLYYLYRYFSLPNFTG